MNRATHDHCSHPATKADRRRCRTATRRALASTTVTDLRRFAAAIDLEGRSKLTTKGDLVEALAFQPAIREGVR